MAFTNVKVSFRFTSKAGDNWTESLYRASNTLGALLPSPTGPVVHAIDWVAKRKLCLSNAFTIATCSIRAAPLPGGGETSTRKGLKFPVFNGVGVRDARRDLGAATVNMPISTADDHTRQYALHGVPDANISYDADGIPHNNMPTGAAEFFDYLIANGWRMKVNKVAANDPNLLTASAITVAAGAVTLTVPGLVIPAGTKKVVVAGAKGWKAGQFNGTWVIGSYNVGTGALVLTSKRLIDPEIFYVSNSATVRLVNATLVEYADITKYTALPEQSTHKVGNPFAGRAGRRSVKR